MEKMADNVDPRIVLLPQPRSHQFVARDVILRDPAMVGRSVARTRITQSNLIFDCRVLSRSHAVVWYDNGKVRKELSGVYGMSEFRSFLCTRLPYVTKSALREATRFPA